MRRHRATKAAPDHRKRTAALAVGAVLALTACAVEGTMEDDDTVVGGGGDDGTQDTAGTAGGTQDTTGATGGTQDMSAATTAGPAFTAQIQDAQGAQVGTAELSEEQGAMAVRVQVTGLDPGFYGLHLHAIGECEPDSAAPDDPSNTGAFLSAGSHIGADQSEHPDHAGDLPTLLVQESGEGWLTVHTDRLTREQLDDEDGAAVMIHAVPDNYANIPERYAPDGPDQDTLGTGDAGDRLACGVISTAG